MEIFIQFFSRPLNFFIAVLGLVFLIQLFYYLYYYLRILFPPKYQVMQTEEFPVSVIICARDEEQNLEENLPLILEQDYPNYEVIVVDDCSEDNSDMTLQRLSKKYAHLKTTRIKKDAKFSHNKKLAVTVGIKAARNEWLAFTDADCKPESKNWLKELQKHFIDPTEIVLGYGGYKKEKGFLNHMIRYETMFIAMQYMTFAMAGKPYMGVGRNLAYRKSLFFNNKGFAGHHHIDTGDDDIFINQTANKKNTRIVVDSESHTRSKAAPDFRAWANQKRRHLGSFKLYKKSTRFRLSMEVLSRELFYLFAVLSLLFTPFYYIYIVGAFGLRWILQLIILRSASRRMNEKYLFIPALFYDIILPFLHAIFYILNLFSGKKRKWK